MLLPQPLSPFPRLPALLGCIFLMLCSLSSLSARAEELEATVAAEAADIDHDDDDSYFSTTDTSTTTEVSTTTSTTSTTTTTTSSTNLKLTREQAERYLVHARDRVAVLGGPPYDKSMIRAAHDYAMATVTGNDGALSQAPLDNDRFAELFLDVREDLERKIDEVVTLVKSGTAATKKGKVGRESTVEKQVRPV